MDEHLLQSLLDWARAYPHDAPFPNERLSSFATWLQTPVRSFDETLCRMLEIRENQLGNTASQMADNNPRFRSVFVVLALALDDPQRSCLPRLWNRQQSNAPHEQLRQFRLEALLEAMESILSDDRRSMENNFSSDFGMSLSLRLAFFIAAFRLTQRYTADESIYPPTITGNTPTDALLLRDILWRRFRSNQEKEDTIIKGYLYRRDQLTEQAKRLGESPLAVLLLSEQRLPDLLPPTLLGEFRGFSGFQPLNQIPLLLPPDLHSQWLPPPPNYKISGLGRWFSWKSALWQNNYWRKLLVALLLLASLGVGLFFCTDLRQNSTALLLQTIRLHRDYAENRATQQKQALEKDAVKNKDFLRKNHQNK